jgi:hypothetical protein
MADEIKINRPQVQQQPQPQYNPPMAMASDGQAAARPSKMPWIVLAVVVLLLIIGAVVFRGQLFGKAKNGKVLGASTTAYQAVFLTNGQVYFGKLSNASGDYITLDDIYYLQVVQPPLQGQQQPGQQPAGQQPQISLVKLGNELHGPVDQMHISRTQVLFYEDLKDDGQVVKAIVQDKNTKK